MTEMNSALCAAFWKHTNVRPGNKIFPCCRFKEPIQEFDGDLSTILDTQAYELLREKSLAGVKMDECQKCYYEESIGKHSLRNWFNENYECGDVKLEFVELGFNNICNLTCDGCNEEFSSSWAKKLNLSKVSSSVTEITNIPDTLKKVLFLGGEPLMSNSHLKFLYKIQNKKDIALEYNTNGSFLLTDELIDEIQKFKKVTFVLSIDGYGALNEKVRTGSKWADIINFIAQIQKLNFGLEINSVIHLNNWHGFKELADFNNSLNVIWHCRILTHPEHLDIINLDSTQKMQLAQLLNNADIPSKEAILKHINRSN